MNQEAKAIWLAALRSGNYKQGIGQLKGRHYSDNSVVHCCLGVACDSLGLKYTNDYRIDDDGFDIGYDFSDVGLSGEFVTYLYQMNDGGYSFSDIADFIEINL